MSHKPTKKTLTDLIKMKEQGASAAWVTVYDLPFAHAAERAGVDMEAMPEEPASQIARQLRIPIYGIGVGRKVDGQLLIMHDLMGFYQPFRPWFAKCYLPLVAQKFADYLGAAPDVKHLGRAERRDGLLVLVEMAVAEYVAEVRKHRFPCAEYTYPVKEGELEALRSSTRWKE